MQENKIHNKPDLESGALENKSVFIRLLTKIKNFYINNFTIYKELAPMIIQIDSLKNQIATIRCELEKEIELITKDLNIYRNMVEMIAKELPDMFWLKDLDGRYMFANESIKEKLLLSSNPIGQTDVQLASAAKLVYGPSNHDFGEKCFNSDDIIKQNLTKQRFMESGKVKGKMLYLEVYKAPLIINGEFIGVFGSGRDMTDYVEAYLKQRELLKQLFPDVFEKLDNIFAKYSFESDI